MSGDTASFFKSEFAAHLAVARDTSETLFADFHGLLKACAQSVRNGGKILFFGNGGSASDSQHLATELTIRYTSNRLPIAAIALNTDSSALTACGNDLGFDEIFARQVQALGRKGDVAIGISTSGRSPNVLKGLRTSREIGMVPAAFGGKDGGELRSVADHVLVVRSNTIARIQEMHITLGHVLCGALELELGLVEPN